MEPIELRYVPLNPADAEDESGTVRHLDDFSDNAAPATPEDPEYEFAHLIDGSDDEPTGPTPTAPAAPAVEPQDTEAEVALAEKRAEYDRVTLAQENWDAYYETQADIHPSDALAVIATGRKLGPRPVMPDELSELFNPQSSQPSTPEQISARSIIEGLRQRRLDACTTDVERSQLRAQFAAEDDRRKRGPLA